MAEVAEFELARGRVLVPYLTGCGVQFNQHVFAAITDAPKESFPDFEKKVLGLAPQLVRLFFNDRQASAAPDKKDSFVRAVELAQRAGATINITWQSGALATPQGREESMSRFADVLEDLATKHGIGNLRWVTVQNEPNTPPQRNPKTGKIQEKQVTPERLDDMYLRLDKHLTTKGIRRQIRFMGGDLIRGPDPPSQYSQKVWFEHMAKNLAEILDAYSVHIYWNYWRPSKFEERLEEVQEIVRGLAQSARKPVFVTEYGVRGKRREQNKNDPGTFEDGTPKGKPLEQTNVAAFQHAWFQILAAQLGYAGTVKWDCYHGKYDRGTQSYYAIGPGRKGWPLYPMYYLLWLITNVTEAGWRVVAVERNKPSAQTKHLAAFAGPANELTIVGLDSRGATVNGVSPTQVSYAIGGLSQREALKLIVWNRDGDGKLVRAGEVSADGGVARVTVPLHAVFALTTKTAALP